MHRDVEVGLLAPHKKQMVLAILDKLCEQIEITGTQYQIAKTRYEAVGAWLSASTSPYLGGVQIYPQGSIALGTAVKPIGRTEFDVDLVCFLPHLQQHSTVPGFVKKLVGNRLKEHERYRTMLEEKQRCWRINYANEFHLDITPSINNQQCFQGGELVPDKALAQWKATNPRGYIGKFEEYAALRPRFMLTEVHLAEARADVAPLPEQTMSKPFLKRIVQLLKRHRDHMFLGADREPFAPISIIITTLIGWAYARCAAQKHHFDAFDFITAVIREMPTFIRTETQSGRPYFVIENETTKGENFAEKWNHDVRLAEAFFAWHRDVLASVEGLLLIEGVDRFAESLSAKFGAQNDHVRKALSGFTDWVGQARSAGSLAVAPALGIIAAPAPVPRSVFVPKNTFFGR